MVPVDRSCTSVLSSVPRAGVVAVANIIKVVVVEESVVNVICGEPFLHGTVHVDGVLRCFPVACKLLQTGEILQLLSPSSAVILQSVFL